MCCVLHYLCCTLQCWLKRVVSWSCARSARPLWCSVLNLSGTIPQCKIRKSWVPRLYLWWNLFSKYRFLHCNEYKSIPFREVGPEGKGGFDPWFDTLDMETLMYSFYFQPASMQQYLASRSLKNKSWKFNEETRRWFSLSDANPVVTTKLKQAGESLGQYIHFDPNGWAFRG